MLNRLSLVLLISLVIITFIGCDNRAKDLNTLIKHQIDSASNHLLYFDNFKKIDGVEVQNGSKKYELTFKGGIYANKNLIWSGSTHTNIWEQTKISLDAITESSDSTASNFVRKDFGFKIDGRAVFEKRDSGWQLIAIYL